MKLLNALLLFFATLSLCYGFKEENDVIILNKENFDLAIRSHPQILIEFYTPYGWMQQDLLTHFSYAAETLKEKNSTVKLGKVDITVEVELARRFRIRSFPTVKFFVGGEERPYTGGKSETEILEWMEKNGEPKAEKIETLEEFENTIKENDLVLVYWGSETDYDYTNFVSLALTYPEVVFGSANVPEINVKYPIIENAKVTLFKKFDQPRVEFTGLIHKTRLSWFIRDNKEPLVIEFGPEHSRKLFYGELPTVMVVLSDNEESKAALECLSSVADHLKGKILITKVSKNNPWREGVLEELQATGKDLPVLAIVKPTSAGPLKYLYEDTTINGGIILQFYHKCSTGKKQAQSQSEPVPEKQEGEAKVVVGKTFNDVVLDNTKDVLLLTYTTGDKNANTLFKIWEEFAVKAKSVEDLVVAKINVSANELSMAEPLFPTILFYPKDNKANIEKYTDPINADSLWSWIQAKRIAAEKAAKEKAAQVEVEPVQPEVSKENKEEVKTEEKATPVEVEPVQPNNEDIKSEEKEIPVKTEPVQPEPLKENKEDAKAAEKTVPAEVETVQPEPSKENKEDVRTEEKPKEQVRKDQDL